jgi:glutathione S-transferase
MIQISAFKWVPEFARGQVRDLRVRWAKLRRPGAVAFAQRRLTALSRSLGEKPYLDGERFTAGDLMMATVLRILRHTDLVSSDPRLGAYVESCTARPAFGRALAAQIGDFRAAA